MSAKIVGTSICVTSSQQITLHGCGIPIRGYSPTKRNPAPMPPTTPIAHSKTAALSRILDVVPRGYVRFTAGVVSSDKVITLANKFHRLYGIGATPAQRLTRKRDGLANALMVIYWPPDTPAAHWLLLATNGAGLEREQLQLVTDKPRLNWLGYELVRHATRGGTRWTWRRPKSEMAEHYLMLQNIAGGGNEQGMSEFLERLARQPGFHGVREQTRALCLSARRLGHSGELPVLYYTQKVSHGERIVLTG